MEPWWETTPYVKEVAYAHILLLFYILASLLELFSFYQTSPGNDGRFKIKYTVCKIWSQRFFYYTLGLLLYLLFCMMWFALTWAILAAIFNPSVYLPYSAGSLTLMATFQAKYSKV
jgi:hypothetical protein